MALSLRSGTVVVAAGARGVLVVGSDPACDLVVSGPAVAGRHVVLRNEHGVWVAEDLSDGQTFLDGQTVSRLVVLAALELTLGSLTAPVRVHVDPATEAIPPPAPAWPLPAARASADTTGAAPAPLAAAGTQVSLAVHVRLPLVLLVAVVVVPALLQALGH